MFCIEKQMDKNDRDKMMKDPRVASAVDDLLVELALAEKLHPVWPIDPIHQVAIMAEEAGEAVKVAIMAEEAGEEVKEANDAVHKGTGVGQALRRELIQTGAMCIRCLINMEERQ